MGSEAEQATRALGRPVAAASVAERLAVLPALFRAAIEREWDERRFFLWLPVCAGAGVALYFAADREPSALYAAVIAAALVTAAFLARSSRRALVALTAAAALAGGFTTAALRTASVAHPVLDRIRIVKLTGFAEEVDHRRIGARFVLRIATTGDAALDERLTRVRLTTRRAEPLEAGDAIALTARLRPAVAGRTARRLQLRPGRLFRGLRCRRFGARSHPCRSEPAAPRRGVALPRRRRPHPERLGSARQSGARRRHWCHRGRDGDGQTRPPL